MSNKNLLSLLSPAMIFLVIAIAAFLLSNVHVRDQTSFTLERFHQQDFERFIEGLKSGKRNLTTDQWIEHERMSEKVIAAKDRQIILMSGTMRWGGWAILLGILFQIKEIISYKGSLNKPQSPPAL